MSAHGHPRAVRCAVPGADILGETPLWCGLTQSLLWLDIDGGRLQRFHPASGRQDSFTFDARHAGSLALLPAAGQVLLGLDLALHRFDLGTGGLDLLCQVEPATQDNRLNDGRCDGAGRFWVGTMDNQLSRPHGSFYRVDADGSVHLQFGGVIVANTVATSPGGDRLLFSDTRNHQTWQFDLDPAAGTLANRRHFLDWRATRDRADGACMDAEGHAWIAVFGGSRLVRVSPAGEVVETLPLPVTNPTCACLGGPELRTLYVTTARKFLSRAQLRQEPLAGSVLAVDVDVPGLPEHRFGQPARP